MPDYELVERLGAGAFGEVWLVVDRALGVDRAVKFIHPSRIKDPTQFYAEPQTLKALAHPNIVTVEDAGRTPDGRLYLAMEYLPDGSIEDEYKGGIVPIRKALQIICDVCRGAEYAHNKGFIHRDIKPANILDTLDGAGKLSDFGLATRANHQGAASPYGYIAHLAPEVLTKCETSRETDVYAIGVTLYRMVNGDAYLPTEADENELEVLITEGRFPDRSRYRPFVPPRLRSVINKAMHVDPAKRYTTACDLRHALEQMRLQCDWSLTTIANGTIWSAEVGATEYEATLSEVGRGKFEFTLRKGRAGRPKKYVRSDCTTLPKKKEIYAHIHKVLSRVTEKGL